MPVETDHDDSETTLLTVLVIEDDEDTGVVLADLLRLEGHVVRVAKNGTEGLKALRDALPDVLLCDVGLPDLSGYHIIEELRRIPGGRETFAVAVTGSARPKDRERALDAGFDSHFPKPFRFEELLKLLEHAGRKRRSVDLLDSF